jgi:hypothetical protein
MKKQLPDLLIVPLQMAGLLLFLIMVACSPSKSSSRKPTRWNKVA